MKCVKRWQDEGGFGSRIMSGDQQGNYLSVGSNIGLVNVYNAKSVGGDPKPKPLKNDRQPDDEYFVFTGITTTPQPACHGEQRQKRPNAFGTASHFSLSCMPSGTNHRSNWPTSKTPLGHVTSMDFSVGSEYLAIGNNKGRVLLYQLRDFTQQ
ncbi:hypothetical protein EDC04DRAFT_2612031 [Pisolithus marmoratus]|nr:hypothetical protein EDC04DRAFT_2612031 [Pisolithus marmoratus]